MINKRMIKEVIEDARIHKQKFEKILGAGFKEFEFPFTVSFYEHGKFEVEIKGKKATVKPIIDEKEKIVNRLKECAEYYEDHLGYEHSVFSEDREMYNANIEEMIDLIKRL